MAFLDKYIASDDTPVGIPNITMNAPIVVPNGLGQIGLELELEGRRLPTAGHLERIVAPTTKSTWTSHPDGSLRGENQEYVLSVPCNVDEAGDMLTQLYAKFTEMNTALSISNRCSTHVHVNMAEKKINQLTSIVALWSTYEEVLINWCGEERKTNHFCLSSKDSGALINRWNTYLRTGRFDYGEGMKYCALNVRPLYGFGSFEFRCMSASEDPERILDWAKFVQGLCTFASEEFKDPRDMAAALSERGTIELFADICRFAKTSPKFFDAVLHNENNNNFEQKIMEGFRRAQIIVLGHPWGEWLEEIDKVFVPSPFGAKPKKTTAVRFGERPLRGHAEDDDMPRFGNDAQRLGAAIREDMARRERIVRDAQANVGIQEDVERAAAIFRDNAWAQAPAPAVNLWQQAPPAAPVPTEPMALNRIRARPVMPDWGDPAVIGDEF